MPPPTALISSLIKKNAMKKPPDAAIFNLTTVRSESNTRTSSITSLYCRHCQQTTASLPPADADSAANVDQSRTHPIEPNPTRSMDRTTMGRLYMALVHDPCS